jgi:hypothetical protein
MRRWGNALRVLSVAVLGVAGVAGCKDSGLPDRNLPVQEARQRTFGYPTYQPTAQNEPVAAAGRHWIGTLPVESVPDGLLEPIANVDGRVLYAMRGARPPYSRLYSPVGEGRWRPYVRLN